MIPNLCSDANDPSASSTPDPTTSQSIAPEPTISETSSTGSSAPEPEHEPNRPSGGLSAGAKGGIAAGVVIAVLIIIGLAVLCCCPPGFIKRWQKRKGGASGVHQGLASPPKIDGSRAELDGVPKSELEAKPATGYGSAINPAELGGEDAVNVAPGSISRLAGSPPTSAPHSYSPSEQQNPAGSYYDGYPVISELSATQQTAMPPVTSTTSPESASPPPQTNTTSPSTDPAATAHLAVPTIDPGSTELEQLLRSHQELEARRKTLEELSRVQEQQAALQQRINELAAANKTST